MKKLTGAELVTKYNHIFHSDWTQDANCVAAWLMDADEDPLTDNSGHSNNVALKGAGEPDYTASGKFGGGYVFDGINDYAVVSDQANLNALDGYANSYSIVMWIKSSSVGNFTLFEKFTGSDCPFSFQGTSTTLNVLLYDGTNVPTVNYGNVWDNAWHHIVLVVHYADDKLYGYLDGNLIGTGTTNTLTTNVNTTAATYVGNNSGLTYPWAGTLDELCVFNDALSSTEINEIMDYGLKPSAAAKGFLTTNRGFWGA